MEEPKGQRVKDHNEVVFERDKVKR